MTEKEELQNDLTGVVWKKKDRDIDIYLRWLAGETLQSIAADFGIVQSSVWFAVQKVDRYRKWKHCKIAQCLLQTGETLNTINRAMNVLECYNMTDGYFFSKQQESEECWIQYKGSGPIVSRCIAKAVRTYRN